jgi:hypothetical protein
MIFKSSKRSAMAKAVFWWLALAVSVYLISGFTLRFFHIIAYDKWYRQVSTCEETWKDCPSIVYESGISINSPVRKYFSLGWERWYPLFLNSYALFPDGTDLCFEKDGGIYKVYTNFMPIGGSYADDLKFFPLKEAKKSCKSRLF